MPQTKFYGSQVGGSPVISHSYTGSPLTLLRHDIASAFSFSLFLPFIVYPMNPLRSGHLCELYPSLANLWSMFLHVLLIVLQLPFLLSIPFWIFLPVWVVVLGLTGFLVVNQGIWWLLNGSRMEYPSNPAYAKKDGHEHEQWIFLNGVAVGKHWLQSNVDRLALTFGRPVLGVHNKTNGILFDVLQCLIQRNFNYATSDIRACYAIVKETLYNPTLTKVVFILHSQGGIEGGMIIDWLLQEVPQDLLAKLEVYTFGNAANHFNNPHLHLLSQHMALKEPSRMSLTRTVTSVHYHDTAPPSTTITDSGIRSPGLNTTPRSSKQESTSGKTIRYIEHYAHTSDFVARWGVLHFTCNFSLSPSAPRFMGRVFERQGEGHQLNMHYLDSMFPLQPCSFPSGGIGDSGFTGAMEEGNEFMESIMSLGIDGDEKRDEREGWEMSYLGTHGEPLSEAESEVLVRDMSPVSPGTMRKFKKKVEFKVKDLSRLWLYVNGKSPRADETDVGIARMATI
ncbi:uncharacterized protein LY89DRAFT_626491 [Mollisia scopiformis]|uniref:Alpha/beta-hydrolase n=1 Tax=Mollisia scopiformis TaxID=149040 RepID=A0A194WSG5_MOLSC|nr:uncharacterized protein LY89DRAFT_626491 [Mollisia scopiformis]KUJ10903.1 hypothetical protein LY89DRAFT_626491 [Mollisia scopiformis]